MKEGSSCVKCCCCLLGNFVGFDYFFGMVEGFLGELFDIGLVGGIVYDCFFVGIFLFSLLWNINVSVGFIDCW